jgi:hypothetical protein
MICAWTTTCLCIAGLAALAPVGGRVHDNDYDLEWQSTAERASGWSLRYLLHNTRNTHVRIVWADSTGNYIYNGWLEQTAQPVAVSTVEIGTAKPEAPWESWIDIGKLSPRRTGVYEPPSATITQVSSRLLIGVFLKEAVRTLSVKVSSSYANNILQYSLSLEHSEWTSSVRFSWTAADSSAFRVELLKRGRGGLIPLDPEPVTVQLRPRTAPRIRNGSLIVWNEDGTRLASVFAPALAE